jgi:valyl-tRNA synthetase
MTELAKAYEPKTVDQKWVDFWNKGGFFTANPDSKKPPFCVVIPPPNVTGRLHMGHALGMTLEDTLVRWKRMSGFETLWVPGTDHAGISTQTVVERHLFKTTGKRRSDFTREEFLSHVWKWKQDNEEGIISQLKTLGCSCDWSRLRFTMDAGNNRAVRTIFKKLYDDALIFRGDYLVNWDPVAQTAIADDEVEYEERNSHLWHFRYPLADGSGFIQIATTRPETMLGDTAVAVHPEDPKHKHLIGKWVNLPLTDRQIPIIADHRVDPEFGTGMVKVTPAHDPNDYQMGLTHNLPFINIMTPDGKINENGKPFAGLLMQEARVQVVKAMKDLDLVEKIEPHTHRVGLSYRSKAVIEPYLSKQWFVKMDGFAKTLRAAVQNEKVSLIPPSWQSTYYHWIDNLRNWCISRQLWWGHQIPIWYHVDDPEKMICYDGEGVPPEVAKDPGMWRQDGDVLDTWFSSALWPFATLGWPEKTKELEKFYPNSTMICGHDILFFWVARMLMMGEYALGKLPFGEVFLTSLIFGKSYWKNNPDGGITYVSDSQRRDYDLGKPIPNDVHSKWEKMSKSKGNIIDPLEMIEQYGTDAVRMALCASASHSWELDLDRRRFEDFKNFANKVWNGSRFVFMNLEGLSREQIADGLDTSLMNLEDQWILSLLNRTIVEVNGNLSQYRFDSAAMTAYNFFWNDFCSYYLEIAKPYLFDKKGNKEQKRNKQKILVIVLAAAVRLLHPMAPFITEELFQLLKKQFGTGGNAIADHPYTKELLEAFNAPSCSVAPYPNQLFLEDINPDVESRFGTISQIVYQIRNIRGEMNIQPGVATQVHLVGADSFVKEHSAIVEALVKTNGIFFHDEEPTLGFASVAMADSIKICIPLPKEMIEEEMNRMKKEREKLEAAAEKLKMQLLNKEFVEKAPPHLVEKQREQLNKITQQLKEIESKLEV